MKINLYQFLYYLKLAPKPNRIRVEYYIKDKQRYFFKESTIKKIVEMHNAQKFLPSRIPRCLNIRHYKEIMDKYSIRQTPAGQDNHTFEEMQKGGIQPITRTDTPDYQSTELCDPKPSE
jgi:hypothetical protein